MKKFELDIMVPVELSPETFTAKEVADAIIWQHKRYKVNRFAFFALSKGFRSVGYPSRKEYIKYAEMGAEVKRLVADYDIEIGWFAALTLQSGASDEFAPVIKADGSAHKFASCPLDPVFRKRYAEDMALFVKIAKPAFIFTEDDFSLKATDGCFCERHLKEFARREGKYYSREELKEIFSQSTPEAYSLIRRWRELAKDSLVSFGANLRSEVDKVAPETPIGYMQSGGADFDGDVTEAVSRAMAGDKHTPFSRLFGTFYGGVNVKKIPEALYHPLYSKQHIGENFKFYHESDPFPHNKFYTAGKHMKAMLGTVLSYGFDGSLFFMSGLSLVSEKSTESAYGDMYAEEKERFNELLRTAKQCVLKGVEINYDPFINTTDRAYKTMNPLWVNSISRFGIPFITVDSDVAFWDVRQAKYADHDTVMKRLSRGLFLDGDAAKCLCERGYSKYLGVEVGEDAIANTNLVYDISASEILRDGFDPENKGNRMPAAHMFCPAGSGKWLKLNVTDPKCEIVSDTVTFRNEPITTGMTRFENELGGRVVVMSLTLNGNHSQALYNYDRQRIIQKLITWCADEYVYAKEIPDISVVVNEAKDGSGFIGMLTVTNLCEDTLNKAEFHLPEKWKSVKKLHTLDKDGVWQEISFERTADGISVPVSFELCEPVYIKLS